MKIQENEVIKIGKDIYGAIYYVLGDTPNFTEITTERDALMEDLVTYGHYDRASVERWVTEFILYEM